MIDIHNHILPGIDDGCRSLEESLELARLAVKDGIHHIIATPHHANGRYQNEAEKVRQAAAQLNIALSEEGVNLQIHTGQEIRVYKELLDDLNAGKLLTLAGSRYMLLEFSSRQVPEGIEDLLHELSLAGITAIIAHPERNMELAGNLSRLADLIDRGALAQMTTHSVNGLFGRKIQSISLDMCRSNLIHFLSSDAHNPMERPFFLQTAAIYIMKKLGEETYSYYKENADRVLCNQEIIPISHNVHNKKRFLFW
jgi:protein-tyrosine phosphatase